MDYDKDNIFAQILRGELPTIKVYEDDHTLVMMDIMPQSKGHVLVLTKEPAATLFDLSLDAAQACIKTIKKISPALMQATKADGLVVSQFNYPSAGQTVFHVHFHLIPAYNNVALKTHSRYKAEIKELEGLAAAITAAIKDD